MAYTKPITVTLTAELDNTWADDETFASMTDEQIIELLQEDVISVVSSGTWTVTRRGA